MTKNYVHICTILSAQYPTKKAECTSLRFSSNKRVQSCIRLGVIRNFLFLLIYFFAHLFF
ncbi:MAG: hypothetical protein EAZ92_17505 [Candidatus Kapaibacterium sp.]|nr:MAG: hypothetical protein EAZ92_17505 [Candidatus Kapabacteria bacterium]